MTMTPSLTIFPCMTVTGAVMPFRLFAIYHAKTGTMQTLICRLPTNRIAMTAVLSARLSVIREGMYIPLNKTALSFTRP
jgi:hypothetical protein